MQVGQMQEALICFCSLVIFFTYTYVISSQNYHLKQSNLDGPVVQKFVIADG